MEVMKHLDLLGHKAADVVTGFTGIISTISFDLYGCVQAAITPRVNDGKLGDSAWFDITRISMFEYDPVMKLPDFAKGHIAEGRKGCAEKPIH